MSSDSMVTVSFFFSIEKTTVDFGILCLISGESDRAITEASVDEGNKKRNVTLLVRGF